ncbi:hypothetical protein PLESTF_000216900 [Pleodorina starrii]|nr:hypothetical protein PLESTF_000216900 [Pleodorina starrii]
MSGRFQTHTVASEGVELDDNYQKMVADIEEQTQRSGWLFGRGAFDKADLQYLRDFNNSLRYKEVEIEDKEKELWERERARLEAEAAASAAAAAAQQAAALTRRSSGGSGITGAPGPGSALLRGPASGGPSRPAPLLLPVKVKPAGSKHQTTPRSTSPSVATAGGEPPSCKRARTDSVAAAAAASLGGGADAHVSPLSTAAALAAPGSTASLRSIKSEPSPAGPALRPSLSAGAGGGMGVNRGALRPVVQHETDRLVGQQQPQQVAITTRSQSAPDASGGEAGARAGSRQGSEGAAAAPAGLANLLGGYGSEDEEEGGADGQDGSGAGHGGANGGGGGDGGGKGGPGQAGPKLPPPVGLLSPEELLADPRVITEGLLATRPQPQSVQGGDTWDSEEPSGSASDSDA